jgi:hypothetical protein
LFIEVSEKYLKKSLGNGYYFLWRPNWKPGEGSFIGNIKRQMKRISENVTSLWIGVQANLE